jgi:hypothetical protein
MSNRKWEATFHPAAGPDYPLSSVEGPRSGETYDDTRDRDRLNRQARKVLVAMSDHEWHTLGGLSLRLSEPEASISARLRDLRKKRFGSHTVEREYRGSGLWAYRLDPPEDDAS